MDRTLDCIERHLDAFSLDRPNTTTLPKRHEFYLIIHDISKKPNIGTLIRSASAFGCSGIITSAKKKTELSTFGAHGADNRLRWFFPPNPFTYAKRNLGCKVVGVEIRPDANSVNSYTFKKLSRFTNCAFVLGNEGAGLAQSIADQCDSFVYIPHYGGGTASLNVAVAGSLIFHRFSEWAAYEEQQRQDEKFLVDELTMETQQMRNENDLEQQKRETRALKRRLSPDLSSFSVDFGSEE